MSRKDRRGCPGTDRSGGRAAAGRGPGGVRQRHGRIGRHLLFPLVVASSEKLMMVSHGLTIFQGQISRVTYNLLLAGSAIAVVPVLVVAMILRRRVVEGLTLGAVGD